MSESGLGGTIPQWLIVVIVLVMLFVVLERVYHAKTTVDLWGFKLTQGVKYIRLKSFDSLNAHYEGQCKNDPGAPGRQCTQNLGKQQLCFLMHVNENEDYEAPKGWTSCTLTQESATGEWHLVAKAAVCQAGCINLILE